MKRIYLIASCVFFSLFGKAQRADNITSHVPFISDDSVTIVTQSRDAEAGIFPSAQAATPDDVMSGLPAILIRFDAVGNGNGNILSWTTTNETKSNGFYIERSPDGKTFSSLGFVAAKNGGGTTLNEYQYTDNFPMAAAYYYRLKINDSRGGVSYSNYMKMNGGSSLLSRIYPNPAKAMVYVELESRTKTTAAITVADANGKMVLLKKASVIKGTNRLPVMVNGFSAGTYFISVTTDEGARTNLVFDKL